MSDLDKELRDLYPFLSDKDTADKTESLLESIRQKAGDSIRVKDEFFTANAEKLLAAAKTLAEVYENQGRLFTMGNGGSSCDAAHVAVEFQHPVTAGRPSLPAMNLTMDFPLTTAIANDVDFKYIFLRQLEAHAKPGDAVLGFSTSGNSDNLIAAFEKARQMDVVTIGFAGGDGGEMLKSALLDHCLVVASDSIHRVQETHVACYHILWDLTHTLLAENRGKLAEGA